MLIVVKVVDTQGQMPVFHFGTSCLEEGLDFVNVLVAKGEQLLSVSLVDQQARITLPIEAFDGLSVLAPISQLEQEWQSILSGPHLSSL